tara:strand:+ start:1042 stop:1302 length:261 start_codon:yes stop_codon:yes gene_type:complete
VNDLNEGFKQETENCRQIRITGEKQIRIFFAEYSFLQSVNSVSITTASMVIDSQLPAIPAFAHVTKIVRPTRKMSDTLVKNVSLVG